MDCFRLRLRTLKGIMEVASTNKQSFQLRKTLIYFITMVSSVSLFLVYTVLIHQQNPIPEYLRTGKPKPINPGMQLTIISAYWDIGRFQKGSHLNFSSLNYEEWASVFYSLMNPLIIYTDSIDFKNIMENLRRNKTEITKIIYMKRSDFWPFRLTTEIQSVFDQPEYPKYHPNTVLAEYSAIQHAKYAAVGDAIRSNIFESEYYAWLDIGYFRDIVNDKRYFILTPPENHNKSLLAMNEVYSPNLNSTPEEIFKENAVWVGGGMFIGTKNVQLAFEKLYKRAVLHFLERKLMNSDQQVIYAIYSMEGRRSFNPDVELQLYSIKDNTTVTTGNPWFYLGFLCRHIMTNISLSSQ